MNDATHKLGRAQWAVAAFMAVLACLAPLGVVAAEDTSAKAPPAVAATKPATPGILTDERLNALTVEELHKSLADSAAAIKVDAQRGEALRGEAWELRRDARASNPEVAKLEQQIKDLQAQIEKVIDETPAMTATRQEALAVQTRIKEFGQQRIKLLRRLESMGAEVPANASESEAP